ncbi:hypothetical protein NEMBOFW57_010315 [Staphylotrichum longicolle]|uniref:Protein kinase domain-containing protein n=1 Tax=Staphylotrichum longicolle TaxID=669026 RepID=A0AAD4ERA7_9PEZI|nr:hypothetical protein NEMBOFW57_010315 [Staphylotrichum longicolle]
MLERADFNLSTLFDRYHPSQLARRLISLPQAQEFRGSGHPSLSLETKLQLAMDIAQSIQTLHGCGIVPGDIKPANILIFGSQGNYRAKLADFSHAVYPRAGTDPLAHLPGGTRIYAAPESQDPAPVSRLKLTDIYSFGLVFACLMVGKEIFSKADLADVDRQKRNGTLLQHLHRLILSTSDASLSGLPALCDILKFTVQPLPDDRDFAKAIAILARESGVPLTFPASGGSVGLGVSRGDGTRGELEEETLAIGLGPSQLSIPYQSLLKTPDELQRHVVSALEHAANQPSGLRTAAAAFELGVCYSSGFGIQRDPKHDDRRRQDSAMSWLLRAAELGDDRARLSLIPTFEAFGGDLPGDLPIKQWLQDIVQTHGDSLALEQLFRISPSLARTASEAYQCRHYAATDTVLLGQVSLDLVGGPLMPLRRNEDTVLHFLASTGDLEGILAFKANHPVDFLSCVDEANSAGDTALIQATRAGHAEVVFALVDMGADAAVHNHQGETALHHLANIDSEAVNKVAFKLARAGALSRLHLVASGAGPAHLLGLETPGPASAALRAVYKDNPFALRALFDLEAELAAERRSGKAELLSMLEVALAFHRRRVLPVLGGLVGLEMDALINSRQFWQNNRFSTPLETCVFGPVSAIPSSGYNYPEQFIRIVRFGQHYLDALATCIDFLLRHGARVRESGMLKFLFYHNRRDAVYLLALREASSLSWARLAIAANDSDMFYAILQASLDSERARSGGASQINYPLLFVSMMLTREVDAVFIWVKSKYGSERVGWVPSSGAELRVLQGLGAFSGPATELMPLYVAASRQRLDWFDALLTLGASLQDSVAPGETVLRLLLSNTCMSPRDLSALFKRCIGCRSEHIITFADVACLLDAHCYEHPSSERYRLKERQEVGRCTSPGPLPDRNEGDARCISYHNLDGIRSLWAYIAKANRSQSRPLQAPCADDDDTELPNLMVFAALRSNWAAVRFLLDIGFPPNGTGALFKEARLRNMPPITALDVVQWTSHVSKASRRSGVSRELRASNRQIASLLLESGASRSGVCGSFYYLLLQPVGDRWYRAWSGMQFSVPDAAVVLVLLSVGIAAWAVLAFIYSVVRSLLKLLLDAEDPERFQKEYDDIVLSP